MSQAPYLRKQKRTRFNVRDFGATGDGTTWDGQAFIDCRDAAIAAGVRKMFVPEGDYVTTAAGQNFPLVSNFEVEGVGYDTVFLDAVGNLSQFVLSGISHVRLANFRLAGTGALGTAGRGAIYGYQSTDVEVQGVLIDDVGTCAVSMGECSDWRLDHVVAGDSAEHSFYVSSSTDVTLDHCRSLGAGRAGGVSTVVGLKLSSSTRTRVRSMEITNSLTEGIIFESDTDTLLDDCYVWGNTQRGIRILAGSTRPKIRNSRFRTNATGDVRDFGSTGALMTGCHHIGTAPTASVLLLADGTVGFEAYDNDVTAGPSGGWTYDIKGTNGRIRRNRIRSCDYGIISRAGVTSGTVASCDVTASILDYSVV